MTISSATLLSQKSTKTDNETQTLLSSKVDMIHQLILQMNLHMNDNETKIDYNPVELSRKLFNQCATLLSVNNKRQTIYSLIEKQFLNFGRYEIEILFPVNNNQVSNAIQLFLVPEILLELSLSRRFRQFMHVIHV